MTKDPLRLRRRLAVPVLVGAIVALTTACGAPAPATTTPPSTAVPSSPVAEPAPESTAPTLPDPTCENIIGETSLTQLVEGGWEYEKTPFSVGGEEIPDGLICNWTNAAEQGGNIVMFGWAPVTAEESSRAQESLESDGWIREEAADGVYITEDPAFALTVDPEGYGMTYLFGDGYVQFADVKQGLLVIQRR